MKKPPKGWDEFLFLCSKIDSKEELESFFQFFLTIEEKHTIASRCLVVKELMEQTLSQREIAKVRGVSIAQITRGSNALKVIPSSLRKFLEKYLLWRP